MLYGGDRRQKKKKKKKKKKAMAMRTRRGGCAPARGCPQVAAAKTPAPGGKAGLLWPRAGGVANGRSRCCLARRRLAVYPRRLRACSGVLVELSAPPTGSASAPRRGKMRGCDRRWCAGGNRCRHPRNGTGRIAAGRDGGSGGGRSSLDSAGRSQRCRRSVRGSGPTGARRAGGGGVAGAALAPVGPARGYRQRRDCPDRPRVRNRDQVAHVSMHATWPARGRPPRGFTGIGGVGAGEERSRCCAWCEPAGWKGSRTGFSLCRLTAYRPRSERAPEPHRGPGSLRGSRRPKMA